MLLQSFICIVYAKLFEAIILKNHGDLIITQSKEIKTKKRKSRAWLRTLNDSNPYISRILIDLPVRDLPTSSEVFICSTSQLKTLA